MPKYECARQIECLLYIEADDEDDLVKKLENMDPDDVLEQADGVAFATEWMVTTADRKVLDFGLTEEPTDEDVEDLLSDVLQE